MNSWINLGWFLQTTPFLIVVGIAWLLTLFDQ